MIFDVKKYKYYIQIYSYPFYKENSNNKHKIVYVTIVSNYSVKKYILQAIYYII